MTAFIIDFVGVLIPASDIDEGYDDDAVWSTRFRMKAFCTIFNDGSGEVVYMVGKRLRSMGGVELGSPRLMTTKPIGTESDTSHEYEMMSDLETMETVDPDILAEIQMMFDKLPMKDPNATLGDYLMATRRIITVL